jgi:NADH-quinone oxidoreductase subunit M
MLFDFPLVSLTIWIPILGGIWVLFLGEENDARTAKLAALIVSILAFVISLPLYFNFDASTSAMQYVERIPWIPAFDIHYHVGLDGISMPLILLTTFTTILVILAGWDVIKERASQYLAAFLFLEGLMIGAFAALDAILFYVFWEALLVPMFLIIGIWGGPNRVYATIKFFLYTFLGSVLMLVAFLYLYSQAGSFAILDFHALPIGSTAQALIFFAFLAAFAVILAAVMLKLGGYGFFRFSLPITPDASSDLAWLMIALSLIAIVYIGFVALIQPDMKKLIAYSSIAHMGFVTLGLFIAFSVAEGPGGQSAAAMGMQGGMIQMISHGFISGALFLCVGVMYDRLHSRQIADYGGVVNTMPIFASFMMLFALANSGLPGTSGFVGEFFVILGSFQSNFWIAVLAATTLILGAAYSLWMYKRVIFGEIRNEAVADLEDIGGREFLILALLAIVVLLFGIWPAPILDVTGASIDHLLEHIARSKL